MFVPNLGKMNINHTDDEFLLQNDFNRLLINKQSKIRYIISVAIRKNFFGREEMEDAIQDINRKLLEKSEQLKKNYNGTSTVDAYLQSVIYHESCQYSKYLHKVIKTDTFLTGHENAIQDSGMSPLDELVIQDEVRSFDTILKLYPRQRFQLELLIKMLCRFPLEEADIKKVYPGLDHGIPNKMVANINGLITSNDLEVFKKFTELLNEAEINHPQPESILHLIKDKIRQIIDLLNSKAQGKSAYNMKSFLILAEKYFSMKKNRNIFHFFLFLAYIGMGSSLVNNF